MNTKKYTNIIIDGNNTICRAFYVKQKNDDETVLLQFLRMLKKIQMDYGKSKIYITWDIPAAKKESFRKNLCAYKATREVTDSTKRIHQLIPRARTLCAHLGLHEVLPYSLEADDVIYYLSRNMKNNLIITADHDLLQAVDADNDVIIATTGILVNAENFEQIKGVPIDKYVLFKSVLGDKSDNVIGLSGYGAVKAKNLCLTENATNSLNQEQNDIIENNKKIVDLQWAYDNFLEEHTFYEKQLLSPSIFDKEFLKKYLSENNLKIEARNIEDYAKLFKQ